MFLLKFQSLFKSYLWPEPSLDLRHQCPVHPSPTTHFSLLSPPSSCPHCPSSELSSSMPPNDPPIDTPVIDTQTIDTEVIDAEGHLLASPERRFFLQSLCASALLLSLPGFAHAQSHDFWSQPRRLRLYRPQLNKTIDVIYWANGQLQWEGYLQICYLFQDHRQRAVAAIDVRLLDLLCAMQAWTSYYGYDEPIQLNSGYRTQATNQRLEGAALNSMHLHGRAADVVFRGLPVSYIGQLAQHYSGGGVGFYPQSGFVHVDTGRIRTWGKR